MSVVAQFSLLTVLVAEVEFYCRRPGKGMREIKDREREGGEGKGKGIEDGEKD